MKKAQVTLFIIIAVIMLAAFGFGFYFLIQSNRANAGANYYDSAKFSFDSDTNVLNAQIQNCLADKTRDGLDYFGLKEGISEQMIENLISASMEDCVDFSYFEARGYQIEREDPYVEVEINDYTLLSSLTYPIAIKKGSRLASLERFEFGMPREKDANLGEDGIADEDIFIVTEDNDAEFFIPEGIQALDASGNPISEVKVKVQDRNVNGLANRVVVGNAIYEGLPSGATFSPALEVKFNVKYGDKPMYMDPKNMMCAYYDEGSDIWRTYMTLGVIDNGPLEKTYTVKCLVEHFTLMAVVNCGAAEYNINLEPLFVNPIVVGEAAEGAIGADAFLADTGKEEYWMENSKGDSGTYKYKTENNNPSGYHIFPEIMAEAKCILDRSVLSMGIGSGSGGSTETPEAGTAPEQTPVEGETEPQTEEPAEPEEDSSNINSIAATHFYSGDLEGHPVENHEAFMSDMQEDEYCNNYLLQDWDADDDPENGNPNSPKPDYFEYKFIDGLGIEIVADKITDLDNQKINCYTKCAEDARKDILEYIEKENLYVNLNGVDLDKLISGDGINDLLDSKILYCELKLKFDTTDEYEGVGSCIKEKDETLIDNINNRYDSGDKETMEYPFDDDNRKKAFYATPKTWGYARTKATEVIDVTDYDEASLNEAVGSIVIGGYGEFFFSLNSDGNACQKTDENSDPENKKVGVKILTGEETKTLVSRELIVYEQGSSPSASANPVVFKEPVEGYCSDNCIWTLNDPIALGQLAGATVDLGGKIITGTPGEGVETTEITVGQLKSGWNSLRVYVNNLADFSPGTLAKDPVFYATGTLSFIGMGFASEDECGTTLADRMNYLIKAGDGTFYDGNYNAEGMEANCLYSYAKSFNNHGSWREDLTSLCGDEGENVNFQDPDFLAVSGMGYCACIAYTKGGAGYGQTTDSATVRCEAACDANNAEPEKQTKCKTYCGGCTSFTEISPNGGKCDVSAEGATTCACPDRLDSSRDMGCKCGEKEYLGEADKFCCAGQITDTMSGGCRNGNMDVCCCKTAGGGECTSSSTGSCAGGLFAVDNPIFCDINIGGCKKDEPVQGLPQGSFSQVYCIDSTGRYGCGWDQNAHTWSPSGKWTLMEDCAVCDKTGRCVTDSNGEEVLPPTDTDCPTDVVLTATGNNGNPNYWIGEGDGHLCQCNKDVFNPNPTSGDINKKCCPFDEGEKFKDSCDKPASDTTCPIGQKLDQSTNYGCTCKGNENIWNNNPYSFCCANDEKDPGFKLSKDGTTSPCTSTGGPGPEPVVPDSCNASNKCTKDKPICCKTDLLDTSFSCQAQEIDCASGPLKKEGYYDCPTNEDISGVTECMCGDAKKSEMNNVKVCCRIDDSTNEFRDNIADCPGMAKLGDNCANNLGKCYNECLDGRIDITDKLELVECEETLRCCTSPNFEDQVCCKPTAGIPYLIPVGESDECSGIIDIDDFLCDTGRSTGPIIIVPCCTKDSNSYCSFMEGDNIKSVILSSDCSNIPGSDFNPACIVCNHQKSNSDYCSMCQPYLGQYPNQPDYCMGVTDGSADPGLNLGYEYPVGCKVCGDSNQPVKSDNRYTCKSTNTWEKVDCPTSCRDIGDCNAQCYAGSGFCKGTTAGTADPGLDGEYPVGCKVCGESGSKGDNFYTCQNDGIWVKVDCKNGQKCDESIPCYARCN